MYRFPVLLLGFGLAACADAQSRPAATCASTTWRRAPSSRIELPGVLAEVSGIAYTPDGRLLAQGDESAVIYQVEFPGGRVVKRFAIGDAGGPLLGDFEDIQVVGDRVFLVTSEGQLVEAKEGARRRHRARREPDPRPQGGVRGRGAELGRGVLARCCSSARRRRASTGRTTS